MWVSAGFAVAFSPASPNCVDYLLGVTWRRVGRANTSRSIFDSSSMNIAKVARWIVAATIATMAASAYAEQFTLVCRLDAMNGQIVRRIDRNFIVDFGRKTVDELPAYITDDEIKWQSTDEKQSTTTINRRTGQISVTGPSVSSSGECAKPRKRQKPQ